MKNNKLEELILTYCDWANDVEKVLIIDMVNDHIKDLFNKLFEEIKHGDQEHQDWLKNKINNFLKENINDIRIK